MYFNERSELYSHPFRTGPSQDWIQNVKTKMSIEEIAGFLFPATLNDAEYESSYVCSPYNALISYSKDELVKINNRMLRIMLILLIHSIGKILKLCKVNKNFCINNFLLSTNPYPKWLGEGAEEHLNESKKRYPSHAIMYRSLNYHTNKALIHHLQQLGFILVASRQVYLFDLELANYKSKNNFNNDRRTLAKTNYKLVMHDQISEKDYADILKLYNDLYLEKYSKHNPQFTLKLIAYWHQKKLLTMMGLRDQQGILQNCCLNLSSGASQFKMLRGGIPFIEYTAAYINHLPLYRRITWKTVQALLNGIFVSILKKYQL
ncbi:MAG: hypothetical protein HYX60_02365 [Legionella longbeachae]|nr:hypothetical protein [Legionella longbeachae]